MLRTTTILITYLLLTACTNSTAKLKTGTYTCADFKQGSFASVTARNAGYLGYAKRDGNDTLQVEYFKLSETTEYIMVFRIKWISDCNYKLQYLYTKDDKKNPIYKPGDMIDVFIEGITRENTAALAVTYKNEVIYDTIEKVETLPVTLDK